jgi:3-phenylpropionate/trans-cinnamate dioxygenase ferredoxin reductase subunit
MVSTEKLPQLGRLGLDAAELIAGWLRDAGIELIPESEVSQISAGRLVHLSDGTMYSADLILSAVGVVPHTEVAQRAGLQMKDGRILVDESMRTSAQGVFAAGDAALAFNMAAGRHLGVEHWGDADAMGTIAGTVAAGRSATWSATPGFWSEIGSKTLKYAAWGDGYDTATTVHHDNGGLTIWYSADGVAVGVLTHDADDDYERGSTLIADGAPPPE